MNKNLIKKIAVGVAGVLVVSLAFMGAKSMFDSKYEKKGVQAPAPRVERVPAKAKVENDPLETLNYIIDFSEQNESLVRDVGTLVDKLHRGESLNIHSPLAQTILSKSDSVTAITPSKETEAMHSRFVTKGLGSLDAALDIMETDSPKALRLIDEYILEVGITIEELSKHLN